MAYDRPAAHVLAGLPHRHPALHRHAHRGAPGPARAVRGHAAFRWAVEVEWAWRQGGGSHVGIGQGAACEGLYGAADVRFTSVRGGYLLTSNVTRRRVRRAHAPRPVARAAAGAGAARAGPGPGARGGDNDRWSSSAYGDGGSGEWRCGRRCGRAGRCCLVPSLVAGPLDRLRVRLARPTVSGIRQTCDGDGLSGGRAMCLFKNGLGQRTRASLTPEAARERATTPGLTGV